MASLAAHRVRAVLSAAFDGVVVGAAEAVLDAPPRSWARGRVYLVLAAAVSTETVVRQLPELQRVVDGLPAEQEDPREKAARQYQALLTLGWGALVTVVDGPLARALRSRGHTRPHLLLGVAVGVATAVSTLPVWWHRAAERAAEETVEQHSPDAWDAALADLLRTTSG